MFSPRLLVVLALGLTVAAAIPANNNKPVPRPVTSILEEDLDDGAWLTFPLFGNLFAPLWKLFPSFSNAGPKIVADDDKFQVIVNVKDYAKSDLKVKVRGTFIMIQGTHEANNNPRDIFASQFFQTYSLPENASAADVTAELTSDGFLIVTAPIKPGSKAETADREVEITETGKPYQEETTTDNLDDRAQTVVPIGTISDSEDDRREPTTPSQNNLATASTPADGESTEKDNSIPHGNEIVVP